MESNKINLERSILAGFIGTLIVTILLYLAPALGMMPKMDIAAMIDSPLHGGTAPEPMSSGWWVGMFLHFVAGTIVFPLLYAYFLTTRLPGNSWTKGTIWGLILWVFSEVVLMPIAGMGLFSSRAPDHWALLVGNLIALLIYGALLGGLAEATAHFHWPWHRAKHA